MAHKTLVNGTAYEVIGGRTLVNGTGYSIKGGRTLVGGTAREIRFGTPIGSIAEGTLIDLPENGVMTQFYVIKHNYESGLNGAGRTLVVRRDVHSLRAWHSSNSTRYSSSSINTWLNNTYKQLFSSEMQTAMGTTKFYSGNGGNTTDVSTISGSVFLVSATELGLTHSGYTSPKEGTTFPAAAHIHLVAMNGALSTQWTRTPAYSHSVSNQVFYVKSPEWFADLSPSSPTASHGVRPCFTLPADYLL